MPKQKSKLVGRADAEAADGAAVAGAAKLRGKRKMRPAKTGAAAAVVGPTAKGSAKKKTLRKGATRKIHPAMEALASVAKVVLKPKSARPAARPGPLERLEIAIDEVRHGGRTSVRTRKLQLSGLPKMAQKVIEEAGEVAIEAILGNRTALINESADLFYNLAVLLHAADVPLAVVLNEMERREITLGMAEKLPKTVDPDA